jgi:hypothetical protein
MSDITLAALSLAGLAIGVPAFSFVRAVLKVRAMRPVRSHPLWPMEAAAVPAGVAEAWAATQAELEQLGVSLVTYGQMLGLEGTGGRVLAFAIHVHNEHGHYARVTATGKPGAAAGAVSVSVTFWSQLDGGAEVTTSNFALPRVWPSARHIHAFRFPGLKSVAALYAAHRRLVARVGGDGARGVLLALGTEDAARLPEPSANPSAMEATPDDTVPDDLGDKLRRAWDWISGNY